MRHDGSLQLTEPKTRLFPTLHPYPRELSVKLVFPFVAPFRDHW